MFQFSLCLELGIEHPDFLLKRLTSKQLVGWEYFYSKRPFGSDMGFYQAGMIACMIANVNLKKGRKPFQPEDFIPKFGEVPGEGWKKIRKALSSMATVKRKKKHGKRRKHNS